MIKFTVPGNPRSKPRPRTVTKDGKTWTYTPKHNTEEMIGWKAKEAGVQLSDGPIEVELQFYLKDNRKVDGDNLEKLVLDALNGIAWMDDCQIIKCSWEKHIDPQDPRTEVVIKKPCRIIQEIGGF